MAPTGKTEKQTRWINYSGSWRVFKITTDDPRYAQSAPYDADADDKGRPDARLSGADVQEGRTVADIEQQLADDKAAAVAAAEQQTDAAVTDKARRPGGRRATAATRRGSSVSDSDEN